jgi:hypothetical protein
MAKDLDCAIWVPTQGTKDSMNSPEVVRMDQASGSAKKVHVAQLILSIARAIDDIDKSRAVIGILKNRSGKSGKVFNNVYFDNGTCTISCKDTQEFDNGLAWEEESEKIREENRIKNVRYIASLSSSNGQSVVKQQEKPVVEGNFIGTINNDFGPNQEF